MRRRRGEEEERGEEKRLTLFVAPPLCFKTFMQRYNDSSSGMSSFRSCECERENLK